MRSAENLKIDGVDAPVTSLCSLTCDLSCLSCVKENSQNIRQLRQDSVINCAKTRQLSFSLVVITDCSGLQ